MKQTIRFKGLSLNRDEQSVEPGELSLCGGVELHDGALRPSVLEGTSIAGGAELPYKLLYVHKTANFTNYISANGNNIYSSRVSGSSWVTSSVLATIAGIRSVTSVGNTLIVFGSNGLYYFLCKQNSGVWTYKYLGQKPPFLELQFNLHHETSEDAKNTEEYKILFEGTLYDSPDDTIVWPVGDINFRSEVTTSITEQVMARVNERISKGTSEGKFYAPFFVRYCYRLYDGSSLIMHSPPVLMMPNLQRAVLTSFYHGARLGGGGDWQPWNPEGGLTFSVFVILSTLQVKLLNNSALSLLKSDWGDIVKSVDIFVSPQFSRIDTSKKIECAVENYNDPNMSIYDGESFDFGQAFADTYPTDDSDFKNTLGFQLPEYPEGEFLERIRNNSSFFLLASYKTNEISLNGSFTKVSYEDSKVANITVQEQMTDDYKTHNILIPSGDGKGGLYVYNHRLNVYGISEQLFHGFPVNVAFPYVSSSADGAVGVTAMSVLLNTDFGRKELPITLGTTQYTLPWLINNGYYFYPDGRGYALKYSYSGLSTWRSMDESLTLNGSVSFLPKGNLGTAWSGSTDDIVPLVNKVYTSRADNPFYFPNLPGESGINTVGMGEIIGISVATRALSQGQVGDHDLIVFATDGIWVLKVSSQGTYSNMHNISREICGDPDSICQLDQSVFFATSRSLSRIRESDVVSISDVLEGPYFDIQQKMGGLYNAISDTGLRQLMNFNISFEQYLQTGRVIYDYISSRIIVLPSNYDDTQISSFVALVFSIRDRAWSTMCLPRMRAAVNSYPSPYFQYNSGNVVCLDKPYDYNPGNYATAHKGIIITRTLTYSDSMDVMRGFRQMSDLATMPTLFFYGSNNQRTWQLIGQTAQEFHNYLPGHPFRFFRIAIYFSSMYTSEEYQELILEIVNKYAKL